MSRIETILEMLQDSPGDPFLRYALALEKEKAGDDTGALRELEFINASVPDYLPFYYKYGKLCEKTTLLKQAELTYRKGLEVAKRQGDNKTYAELKEALFLISEDMDE